MSCTISSRNNSPTAKSSSPAARTMAISCFALSLARVKLRAPRNCETTTAPPVDRAKIMLLMQLLNILTRETAEILASPNPATIRVSALPTRINKSCSKNKGITRRKISRSVNRVYFSFPEEPFFRKIFLNIIRSPFFHTSII